MKNKTKEKVEQHKTFSESTESTSARPQNYMYQSVLCRVCYYRFVFSVRIKCTVFVYIEGL